MAGRQLIPIENARDQIIVRNEHQLSYGLDDVRRGGVMMPLRSSAARVLLTFSEQLLMSTA
jgi:hypothetical protein